ncbi:dynamin GTPase [Usnea florida]
MAYGSSTTSLADPVLLVTIDKLFQHNIGDYVSLPQLLVVGDQSSGKSSVLEGLTDLPFPRDSGLCTRFATHITFRRTSTAEVSVSILPTANAHPDRVEKLKKYERNLKDLNQPAFAEILGEVHKLMGLKEIGVPNEVTDTFSDDVLKIEICGPKQQHLSVIDVPGIFHNTTAGVTTDADMEVVRNMVNNYMKNPRSVILAVIPANVDIATQEILKMAKECDPKGQRTLGVLTKPDLVDRGAEDRVIDLIEGKSSKLKLGWLMVRNPGQSELDDPTFNRHAAEKEFFKSKEPWAQLRKDRVGVESLQGQLRDILTEMVKKEFPHVKSDINKRLNERKKHLKSLGPCRETREQQHEYLLNLATRFQSTAFLALTAHYGADDLFDNVPRLKLATAVVDRNGIFADDVWKLGHTMAFRQEIDSSDHEDAIKGLEAPDAEDAGEQSPGVRHTGPEPDLDDILHDDRKVPAPKPTGIMTWLENVYKGSRGFELGTFDASLFPIIWKKQSANWDDLALGYVSDIVALVHNFTIALIAAICEDERVQSALMAMLSDGLIECYKKSLNHAKFILHVERLGTPLTANHYFADNLEKSRQQRMKAVMQKRSVTTDKGTKWVSFDKAILPQSTASNTDQTILDLHDILKSYYKVARKRFVDVVMMQAVDYYLINGPEAPLKLFSPTFASALTADQLERIAGEDVSTKRKREELQREIENLTNGKKILV